MASFTKTNGSDFNSSNIDRVEYDAGTQNLNVTFTNGGKTYQYAGVDQSTADQLVSAQSVTKFLNESIRNKFSSQTI
jgi:hypothetical protein